MTKHLVNILFLCLSFHMMAQISPGDLTSAHQELEGMLNCTQCHELGNEVTNQKCLDCHDEMSSLIDANRGYHSSREVKEKKCFECHSEHHGRKFDMMRFDEKAFDHDLTGYELLGAHDKIDCRKCHIPEYISDPDLREREKTFLGLSEECLSCHEDYHQETLDNECLQCHNMDDWKPATEFDHDEDSDYPLLGKHADVECIKCHKKTVRNGFDFQEFADVKFDDCVACHEDPHEGQLPGRCDVCHTENGFDIFKGQRFNHNQTPFELQGAHQAVSCFDCHAPDPDPLLVFEDHLGVDENDCVACHEDPHGGRFGQQCADCHNQDDFLNLKDMSFFNHDSTDYPLRGFHENVDCKECHAENYSDPIDFSACLTCHEDYHRGEFMKNDQVQDCGDCHNVIDGFAFSSFGIEEHQKTKFPLEGAHIATPCFACHVNEEEWWTFRNLGSECYDCHDNIHGDEFVENGITDCKRCHVSESWFPENFNHDLTRFPLEGKHAEVACLDCHYTVIEEGKERVVYKINKLECIDCHFE
ncbi:MAG: hypothetical protein MRY83_19185 [Flavobacteriales bacterium]|nr:hypothetical protein [Flavobacteriales bacterium]